MLPLRQVFLFLLVAGLCPVVLAQTHPSATDRQADWVLPTSPEAFRIVTEGSMGTRALDSRVIGLVTKQGDITQADPVMASKDEQGTVFAVRGRVPDLRTMRWTMPIEDSAQGDYRYYQIRYKARGIHRDYTKTPVLSLAGQGPADEAMNVSLIDCTQVINDDRWHVMIGKVEIGFKVSAMDVHVQTTDSLAEFAIDRVILSEQLPQANHSLSADTSAIGAVPAGSFRQVPIDGQFNDRVDQLRQRTLEKHGVIVDSLAVTGLPDGIPLRLSDADSNLVTSFEDRSANEAEAEFLGHKLQRKYFFPASRDDRVEVAVEGQASEVFLLLAAELPATTGRYGITQTTVHMNDIEQLSIELTYQDGGRERAFPYSLADEGFVIRRALGAYVVPADPDRPLKSVALNNRFFGATVSLGAVTLNTSTERVVPQIAAEPEVIRVPDLAEPKAREPYLTLTEGVIRAGNGYYETVIDCTDGFVFRSIANRWRPASEVKLSDVSGLRIDLDGRTLTGADFKATGVNTDGLNAVITLAGKTADAPLELTITLGVDDTNELRLGLTVASTSDAPISPQVRFPFLGDLQIDGVDSTWVCFPKYRNVISNQPGYHFASNDHAFPMQFMDVYNPQSGIGFALITHNLEHMPIDYAVQKNDAGVTAYIQYPAEFYQLAPGQVVTFVEMALVSHKGDWREAASAYRRWVDTWYKPNRSVNNGWYQRVSLVKDYFLTERISKGDLKVPSMYDRKSGVFRVAEYLAMDKEYWGGIAPDMFHFFQWYELDDVDTTKTQFGELGYGNFGGLEGFKTGLRTMQQDYGTPVSLYTLPDRIGQGTDTGRRLGPGAVKQRPDGSKLVNELTWYVCPEEKAWQDHFVQEVTKVQQETGADAIYMDVVGFWRTNTCYAPDHGHRVPSWCNQATHDLIGRVRESLPDDVVIWTEYPVTDVTSPLIDGNIAYYYLSLYELFSPAYDTPDCASLYSEPSINLYRFLFPDVKQIDLPIGNNGSVNGPHRLKFIFFHGDGVYDNGWFQFDSREREELMIKTTAIKNRYRDCFYSQDLTPLVPTERGQVYANRFGGEGRTLWTVYNGRYTTVRGRVLAVDHVQGAIYQDAWNERELSPTVENGKAYIELALDPQGLGCVVQVLPGADRAGSATAAVAPERDRSDETSMKLGD